MKERLLSYALLVFALFHIAPVGVPGTAAPLPVFAGTGQHRPLSSQCNSRIQFEDVVLISLGDSMTHGTMNATNNETNARNSYIQKVADALGQAVELTFTQPLLDSREDRIDPFVIPTNLGVDGADSFTLEGKQYYKRAGAAQSYYSWSYFCDKLFPWNFNDLYDNVLYPINLLALRPVSQLDAGIWLLNRVAERGDDTKAVVVLWIGNNESSNAALGYGAMNPSFFPIPLDLAEPELDPLLTLLLRYAESRGELSRRSYTMSAIRRNLTDAEDFSAQYEKILTRMELEVPLLAEHADIFLCTLPYYSSVGFLLDSDDLEYYLTKINPAYTVPATFARADPSGDPQKGDRISLITFLFMFFLLQQEYSVDYVNQALADDGLVLSEEEQLFIQSRIDSFNETIQEAAGSHGPKVHLIDTGRYLNDVLTGRTTVTVGDRALDRRWMRGGSLSLDGVHPGYTANAFIANIILERIDEVLGTTTSRYDLSVVMQSDPYVDGDEDGWVPGPDYEAEGFAEMLLMLTDPDDADPETQPAFPADIWDVISDVLLAFFL